MSGAKSNENRGFYTTGEVAKICGVTIRTVIKWFESGKLAGHRIPASRNRRIPRESLLRFLAEHDYPYDPALLDPVFRVLVADDEPRVVESIVGRLARLDGIECHRAHSGYEAGFETARLRPQLLVIDYNLGDLDAMQVLETLNRDEALSDTRVIVMSGFLDEEEVATLQGRGLRFLRKPFDVAVIEREIEVLRSGRRPAGG